MSEPVKYPGLTAAQAEQLDMVYDKLQELKDQVDDALADLDAFIAMVAGKAASSA